MKSLIVGMGIGQLYKTVLTNLGYEVITVDKNIDCKADFTSVDSAIIAHGPFDTVHICTPNFTHFEIAYRLAPHTQIMFIEKPGVANSFTWKKLVEAFPRTRFMMVKNNMWRSNISDLKKSADKAKIVEINWIRKNGVPFPGGWFTTKKLAFGGVSRDLMPHLLSLYIAMNSKWRTDTITSSSSTIQWKLEDINSTEYGTVNKNGTYDVDDLCSINIKDKWKCTANWRSVHDENKSIKFIMEDGTEESFELGWCPEDAYQSMIKEAVEKINDSNFWRDQYDQDTWIHERIEKL
jgi:hypothetical protein